MAAKKKKRILREDAPDPAILHQIAAIEGDANLGGMDLETLAEFLVILLPGHVHGYAPSLPAQAPTEAKIGSAEKVQVMAQRAFAGTSLFHQDDCTEHQERVEGEVEEGEGNEAIVFEPEQDTRRRRRAVSRYSC